MRQPLVWSNGDAAIVRDPSSHRNINLDSLFAAKTIANGGDAPMITASGSPWTRNTARYAWTALRNGGPTIAITGGGTASNTQPRSSATAINSTFETRSSGCAILQTTTQLST